MKKRFLLFITAVLMVISCVPVFGEEAFESSVGRDDVFIRTIRGRFLD